MTARSTHEAHDRLQADLRLLERRIRELGARIAGWTGDIVAHYSDRLEELSNTLHELSDDVDAWEEVEVGKPTRVTHLSEEIDSLEADFRAATEEHAPDYELAMDHQLRNWRSRLDAVRLQGVLGSMELRDDLEELVRRLDTARAGALIELQDVVDDGGGAVVDLRDDIEEVLIDVRHGLERAYTAIFGR
ncbi:MAG: hypothetical protein ACN4GZ_11790 [Acidimicrobiales bacterium]